MYAVINTGGKQYRVSEGQQLEVERSSAPTTDAEVQLTPVLLVDGDTLVTPADLGKASVTAKVVGPSQGPEDHRLHLQEQDEPAPPLGPPPALRHDRDHRHHEGLSGHVEDQGRRLHPERP